MANSYGSYVDWPDLVGAFLAFLVVVILAAGFGWFHASMEAAAYESVTGKQVSTWDAMFLVLRVQAEPQD
jgi:hypothetical protein